MLRLGPRKRAALATAGLTAFALAYATTPLVASDDTAILPAETTVPFAATPTVAPLAVVLPHRDPFAGMPEAQPSTAPSAPSTTMPMVPPPPTLPPLPIPPLPALPPGAVGELPSGAIGPLPPNIGAGVGLPPTDGVRVTALITGARASAIVEDRNGTRVVAVGDLVAGDRVTAIDAAGVHLARGTVHPLSPAGPSASAFDRLAPSPQATPPGGLP